MLSYQAVTGNEYLSLPDYQHTTDVGKNSCTDRHGGTSAAAPIAAGIFALALEVRLVTFCAAFSLFPNINNLSFVKS